MAYITVEEITALPDDPIEAFIEFEAIVRQRFEDEWGSIPEDGSSYPLYHKYVSAVLPAAIHYGISGLTGWERPEGSVNSDFYRSFIEDVDYIVSALKLEFVARVKRRTVALDAATKSKLRHLLDQIRQTVDKLESPAKKDRLYKRINALQEEIDRERTRLDAVGELFVVACHYVAEGAKELEPAVRLIERIGAALGVAKETEDAPPRLPQPPKKITQQKLPKPAPKHTNGQSRIEKKIDDEIPF